MVDRAKTQPTQPPLPSFCLLTTDYRSRPSKNTPSPASLETSSSRIELEGARGRKFSQGSCIAGFRIRCLRLLRPAAPRRHDKRGRREGRVSPVSSRCLSTKRRTPPHGGRTAISPSESRQEFILESSQLEIICELKLVFQLAFLERRLSPRRNP